MSQSAYLKVSTGDVASHHASSAEVYVASRLLSLFPKDEPLSSQLRTHFYYNLLVPHGLVRYGVAPDHPEVKPEVRSAPDPPFVSFL